MLRYTILWNIIRYFYLSYVIESKHIIVIFYTINIYYMTKRRVFSVTWSLLHTTDWDSKWILKIG